MATEPDVPGNSAIRQAFGAWVLAECEKEVSQNLSRLRAIPSDLPIALVELVGNLPAGHQLAMLHARSKKALSHSWSVEPPPQFELNQTDLRLLQLFPYPSYKSRAAAEYGMRKTRGEFRLPKGELKRAARAGLKRCFAKPLRDEGGEVSYLTQVSGVTIYTDVDYGSRFCQMSYSQRLLPRIRDTSLGLASRECALGAVSVLTMAGTGETQWTYLNAGEIPQAVDLLVQSCVDFVEAVPGILEEASKIVCPP